VSSQASPAISIKDLSYDYPNHWLGRATPALKNINLEVTRGESFGFLGHNGAGKTTTIKCLLGLVRPKSGSSEIFGESSLLPKSRIKVGYLPEQPYFYDHLTVAELVEMYAVLAGVESHQRSSAVLGALKTLKIENRAGSKLRSLSKGLMQRVGMAQAIVAKPELLILDEPFSGLDPIGRRDFRELLLGLKSQGTTLFICSHILGDVENLCERASIMVAGELKRSLKMADLSEGYERSFELILAQSPGDATDYPEASSTERFATGGVRLVYSNEQAARAALSKSLDSGVAVESFHKLNASLEDLFIQTVGESRGKD